MEFRIGHAADAASYLGLSAAGAAEEVSGAAGNRTYPARAEAMLDVDRIACRVRSWGGDTDAGLHPATGGDGEPGLLRGYDAGGAGRLCRRDRQRGCHCDGREAAGRAGCRGGHWDARGTLGVDREAPVGLTDIALTFELDTDADAATVQRLVEMSERFCVIYQTLRAPPRLTVTHRTAARG
jgi:hypothetical protein